MQIRDRVFIVTGGGSGLGAATGRMIAAEGGRVVLADVNEAAGREVAASLGEQAVFVRTDVTQESDGQAVVDEALSRFGGLHGLVNCAGIVTGERVLGARGRTTSRPSPASINVNLVGAFNMMRLAAARDGEG